MTAVLEFPAVDLAAGAELRAASLDQLASMLDACEVGSPAYQAILAECARRDRADAARRARRAVNAEWYDAAYAQQLAAEAQTRGNLLSPLALAEGIEEPGVLWTGSEAWAWLRASEELRNYWLEHPRLTVTQYRRQLAGARRGARDADDLAAMDAAPAPAKRCAAAWEHVPGGRVRAATVAGRPAWWAIAADGRAGLHGSRAAAVASLTAQPEPARPTVAAMTPGAIARYTHALAAFATHADSLTARILAARGRITQEATT
jgi:hypothetical protein